MERDEAETASAQNDAVLSTQAASLFPVQPQLSSSGNDGMTDWLRNASFTADLSVINDSVSSRYKAQKQIELESEDDEEVKEKQEDLRPQYELLDSSEPDRDSGVSSSEERKSRKKRRKKKRKRDLSRDAPPVYDYTSSRKSEVRTWESSSTNNKDYYFDSRGDRDNLAFGSLYRFPSICANISWSLFIYNMINLVYIFGLASENLVLCSLGM